MKKTLYQPFIYWYTNNPPHENNIWLYSDPHFNDDEMKYLRKNYIGDEEQIKRINSKVGKNDTIVFLGDIGDISFIPKIKGGRKVLIKGNHDVGTSKYLRKYYTETELLKPPYISNNGLFDEVYEGILAISSKMILSHEPIDIAFALNIHGHDHSNERAEDLFHMNLCAEHINYTPISIFEIIKSGKLRNIPSIHRIAIDKAIQRKSERSND